MYQNRYLWVIFFSLCFKTAFASVTTLEEAISFALKNSPEAKKIESREAGLKASNVEAFARNLLPEVSYFYSRTNLDDPKDTTPGELGLIAQTGKQESKGFEASYNLSSLYTGSAAFMQSSYDFDRQLHKQKAERDDFILSVARVYIDLLYAQKELELYKKSASFYEKLLQKTKDSVARGSAKRTSLYLVEADYEDILAKVILGENNLVIQRNRYLTKVGRLDEALAPAHTRNLGVANLEEALSLAKKNNPDLKASQAAKKSASFGVASSAAAFLPYINIKYRNASFENELTGSYKQAQVSTTLSVPLYKPGIASSVVSSSYNYRASNYEYSLAMQNLETSVKNLWAQYEYYKTALRAKQKILDVRAKIVKDYEQDFNYGRIDIVDKLEEERKFIEAELEFMKTESAAILNIFELKNTIGLDI